MNRAITLAIALAGVISACAFGVTVDDGLFGDVRGDGGAITDGAGWTNDGNGPTYDGGDAAVQVLCPASDASVGFAGARETNGGTAAFLGHTSYGTRASVMRDGALFRMWWAPLGAVPNANRLLYAEASSLDGPWHSTVTGAGPDTSEIAYSGAVDAFDNFLSGASVLRIKGVTYVYYSATGGSNVGAIGLLTRAPGDSFFSRPLGNQPILKRLTTGPVNAANDGPDAVSAFYLDGFFYLLFNDPNAPGSRRNQGGDWVGEYLIRSTDPTFQTAVQSYANGQWVAGDPRTYSVANQDAIVHGQASIAFAPELGRLLWAPDINNWVRWVDLSRPSDWTTADLPGRLPVNPRGIVRTPEGHVLLEPDCKTLRIDLMYHDESPPATRLMHYGVNYTVR
jgi:hypothetical protein